MEKGSELFGRITPETTDTLRINVAETIRVSDVFGIARKPVEPKVYRFTEQIRIVSAALAVQLRMIFANLNNHSSPPLAPVG